MFPFIAVIFFFPLFTVLEFQLNYVKTETILCGIVYITESSLISASGLVRVMVIHNSSEENVCEVRSVNTDFEYAHKFHKR